MFGILVLTIPFSMGLAWYLRHLEKLAWHRVQEETRTKGVAVGKLAEDLGRSTLSE
ncbi:MAG TPA: hypothetical protein VIU34_02045 [Steroidobacter sp.]